MFTLGAIAFGFAAVNLLGGFTDYVFNGLEDSYVYAYGNGHLSIFKKGFHSEGTLHPTEYLLDEKALQEILTLCRKDSRVLIATPQLNITGLISNGKTSTIMMAQGKDPADTQNIRSHGRGFIAKLKMFEGKELNGESFAQLGITKGLSSKLDLNIGDNVVVMASTVDGFMNALDAEVVQTLDAPMEILDDLLMSVPLGFAQAIYDTSSADRINVLLKNADLTYPMKDYLEKIFVRKGMDVEVLTWDQLRPSYLRIHNMFNVIFSFVFIIVLIIVAMSVINTVSMAVLERTREIGTLRALGLKRFRVIIMFATEGAILAMIGSLFGLLLTLLGWATIFYLEPTWIPPNIPKQVPLEIHLVPWYLVSSCLCMICLAAAAAVIPARRAARLSIINALGHN